MSSRSPTGPRSCTSAGAWCRIASRLLTPRVSSSTRRPVPTARRAAMERPSMARAEAPQPPPDQTAASDAAAVEVPPELVAQSLGDWVRGWFARVRAGQSVVLPVIVGLVLITIVFTAISPNHLFLSAGNLVNLFQQSAVFMVLAMAETFALLLGEIDLSVGFVGACGGVIALQLVQPGDPKRPRGG